LDEEKFQDNCEKTGEAFQHHDKKEKGFQGKVVVCFQVQSAQIEEARSP
jgi:hypothetical protein